MNKSEKSLRWVVNQIPDFKPTTNEEKMLVAIKLYSEAGAEEIRRLETENAALRARLGKFDDLHIHMGEKVYIIADDNEIIERFICGVHILSTEIIFVTTTQKNYKSCSKKGIAAHIAHAFENSFGLLPLRDFGERAFIHREGALVRLAELKGEEKNG